jgi:hypothetical protein
VSGNYSKFEVREVVRFLQAEEVSQSEIYRRLASVYGQKVFSRKEVFLWCNKFKDGGTALNVEPEKQRGRPRASHTDENCVIVEGLIKEGRGVKFREKHSRNKLCNTSHPLERNTTVKE